MEILPFYDEIANKSREKLTKALETKNKDTPHENSDYY